MTLIDPDTSDTSGVFDGAWRPSRGGTLEVTNPATGTRIATVGLADADDMKLAIAGAVAAAPAWAATSAHVRAETMRNAAQVLTVHREEVIGWLVREGGAVRGKAEYEVGASIDELWTAAAIATRPPGHVLAAGPGEHSVATRVPHGVVGVISPWNVPLLLAMRALAPALALGNAVVLKPDVHTPVSGGHVIARVFTEAGLPPGVLHVLPGDAAPGEALVSHPDVAMIAFTGSSAVGRRIGATAGRLLKRVSLELGGNNPFLVLADADVEAAASAGAWGSFFHGGQICMQAGRHIVHRAVAEEYVGLLAAKAGALRVGDPAGDVDLGPLISPEQLSRVDRIVRETVAAGASLLAGGVSDGQCYLPTVLGGVTPGMPAFEEEIFGPVAPVTVVDSDDEAVAMANSTEYGLSAAVFTSDVARGDALGTRLRVGMVHVNDQTINDAAHVPFGGVGASGNGARHGADHSWDEFTRWQWRTTNTTPVRYPW
ncbi:aldehyde dehydrogenase family protein [Actinophytocola sp.]|uniref:aldehyde dehydrogenase family protein n=1 Tax=Actinophytocola sp. TaxID=1872138 RepID=UPI00389A1B3A